MLQRPNPVTLNQIVDFMAQEHGTCWNFLWADRRSRDFLVPRHIVFYLAREYTLLSFPQIGRLMRRDHSTIIHGAQQVAKNPQRYEPWLSLVRNRIEKELLNGA